MRRSWHSLLGVVGDTGLELPFELVAKNDCSQPLPAVRFVVELCSAASPNRPFTHD